MDDSYYGYSKPAYVPNDPNRNKVDSEMDYGAIGNAMSGLGNLIDLPGSMVRDAISFSNPFDQLMSPMSSDNRTSGAEISRYWMGGDENSGGNQMAGLLIDILTDPMMLATGGTAAAGRLAGKAGMSAAKGLGRVGQAAKSGAVQQGAKNVRAMVPDLMKSRQAAASNLASQPAQSVSGAMYKQGAMEDLLGAPRRADLESMASGTSRYQRAMNDATRLGAGARDGARQLGDEMYSGGMASLRGARDQAMGLGRRVLGGDRNAMLQSAAIAGNTANTMGGIHQNQEPTIEDMIAQALMQDPDLSEQLLMILSGE